MPTTSSFVPASQVIATATSVLEGSDTMDRAFFKEWVYLGLIEIGPTLDWYDECILYPLDLAMKKPDGFHSAIDLTLYDSNNNEIKSTYRGLGTRSHASDNGLINAGQYFPQLGAPVDLSEDTYYFHIGTNGYMVAFAKLKFWKFPVDENGDLMIPETDILPLVYFIRYMWYLRKDDKQGMAMARQQWVASRNEARAAHKIPSMLVGSEILRAWPSMIPKQRYKKF